MLLLPPKTRGWGPALQSHVPIHWARSGDIWVLRTPVSSTRAGGLLQIAGCMVPSAFTGAISSGHPLSGQHPSPQFSLPYGTAALASLPWVLCCHHPPALVLTHRRAVLHGERKHCKGSYKHLLVAWVPGTHPSPEAPGCASPSGTLSEHPGEGPVYSSYGPEQSNPRMLAIATGSSFLGASIRLKQSGEGVSLLGLTFSL